VVPLDQADKVEEFGGKATNLATLLQNEISVPRGIAVGVSAFVDDELQERAQTDINKWLAKLPPKTKLAVRSSAVNEDGQEHSWAGQFDTYLNVAINEVIDKVQACHLAITDRAKAYGNGMTSSFHIAVVVQEMVKADYAGVLFTRNPIDGSNQMVIEYLAGLAEQLVSGKITPESLIWDRQTKRPQTDDDLPFDLQKLITVAQEIEDIYNSPQDIEWAFAKKKLYIIQARPITTFSAP